MNDQPYIVAIGAIIAVTIVLLMTSGSNKRVCPPPENAWTLTFSIPASNSPTAFQGKTHR